MIRSLRSRLSPLVQPALRLWNRLPMRVQGRITVGLPLVAVFVSTCLALIGNHQRVDIETDIQRKFEMTAALSDLTTLMVNAETGMRGYLLTGQDEYLQPFDQATDQLPAAIARLNALAAAEPGEKPRQDKLQRVGHLKTLTDQQLADLAQQRSYVASGRRDVTDPEIRQHLAYGKGLMDEIRIEVDAMRDEEQELLTDRIADINAIRERDYASVVVALIVALGTRFVAWYLFRKGTLLRVDRLTEYVRSVRKGATPPSPPPRKKDKLGELEHEITLIKT